MVSSSTLTKHLNKLKLLSQKERNLFLKSVLLLPVIHVALLLLGYHRLRGVMDNLIPLKPIDKPFSETEILQRGQKITRMVSFAAQHGFNEASCLRRSLLVWGYLLREGIQSDICFGVRMSNRKLEAHAWIEYNRVIVNDSVDVHERFRTLDEVLPPTFSGL